MRTFIAVFPFLMFSACAMQTNSVSDALSVEDVIEAENVYIEGPVSVRGYLRYGDDAKNLWASEFVYKKVKSGEAEINSPLWRACLALYNDARFWSKLKKLDGSTVIIKGLLVKKSEPNKIYLGRCRDLGVEIENIRRK